MHMQQAHAHARGERENAGAKERPVAGDIDSSETDIQRPIEPQGGENVGISVARYCKLSTHNNMNIDNIAL